MKIENEVVAAIQSMNEAVKLMRAAQRNYFRTRTQEALIQSKQLESGVDVCTAATDRLIVYWNSLPPEGGTWKPVTQKPTLSDEYIVTIMVEEVPVTTTYDYNAITDTWTDQVSSVVITGVIAWQELPLPFKAA